MKPHKQRKNFPGLAGRFHNVAVGGEDQSDISPKPSYKYKGREEYPYNKPGQRDKEILYPQQKYTCRRYSSSMA